MRELFVYWRAAPDAAAAAAAAAQRLQAILCQRHPGLVARLFRRAHAPGDPPTLMETYAHPQGIDAGLQAAIEQAAAAALQAWCRGPRHVEVFERVGG
ncbi:MAG: DUF4936 family protein [Burkholderiales bacterium]|nr:DUF4936 family protein [Burkholderiales bacterium]